jgi:hypothetical protein
MDEGRDVLGHSLVTLVLLAILVGLSSGTLIGLRVNRGLSIAELLGSEFADQSAASGATAGNTGAIAVGGPGAGDPR